MTTELTGVGIGGKIMNALADDAVVIVAPAGMAEETARHAVVDALLGLSREPDRPRVYLMVEARP